jgi:2-dehydro-3-deoxygluconokinase
MSEVVTFGECLLSLRSPGRLQAGGAVQVSVAGAEANVAIGLSRLGHRVTWIGRVGRDEAGSLVRRTLRSEGVDVQAESCAEFTGMLVFAPRPPIGTRVDYHRFGSAGSTLAPSDVVPHLEAGDLRILHITGITPALSPTAAVTTVEAVRVARAAGLRVSLDVNYRARLWSREEAATVLRRLLDHVDLLIASEDEVELVADDVDQLHARGVAEVVVKRGSAGSRVHLAETARSVEAPAVPVDAIDPVGAGDAFSAGYLSATLDGLPPDECLIRGNAVGAFSVSSEGDWEGLPTREELALLGAEDGAVHR